MGSIWLLLTTPELFRYEAGRGHRVPVTNMEYMTETLDYKNEKLRLSDFVDFDSSID